MVRSEGIARLFDLARSIGRELGFEVEETATGGGSDANTTAATGTPTLDGLGPIGGDAHTPAEWIEIESVVPRTALLAGLIVRADRVASVTRADGKEVTWS
jgi:glutamate carboxypeptidase